MSIFTVHRTGSRGLVTASRLIVPIGTARFCDSISVLTVHRTGPRGLVTAFPLPRDQLPYSRSVFGYMTFCDQNSRLAPASHKPFVAFGDRLPIPDMLFRVFMGLGI